MVEYFVRTSFSAYKHDLSDFVADVLESQVTMKQIDTILRNRGYDMSEISL